MTNERDNETRASSESTGDRNPAARALRLDYETADASESMTREARGRALFAWAMRADRAFWKGVGRGKRPTDGGSKDV